MATTTVREHRLAAGSAIFIPSSLAFGLLLAGHHPAFLAAGFGATLLYAGLARRHVQHWDAAEGRTRVGAANSAASSPSSWRFRPGEDNYQSYRCWPYNLFPSCFLPAIG
jgi:hypothetical protein